MASTYSRDQITAYYDRIALSEKSRIYDVTGIDPKEALGHLKELQKYHLTSVPFENLALHYSPHWSIVLHPDELFKKIVDNKRGGYCMELNSTFGTLLRSLNYNIYATGARVNGGSGFGPFDHMLNIVSIGDSRYVVDVGFGSNYVPTQPVRLINDTAGFENVAPASARLVFKAIEGNVNKLQKLWVYQHRTSSEVEWRDMYCFADVEFRAPDFEMMNYWTSTSKKVIFTQKVICNKMILGEDGEIAGTLTLMGDLKRKLGAKSEKLRGFESESHRIRALEKHFGIVLSASERDAIHGTVDEIK